MVAAPPRLDHLLADLQRPRAEILRRCLAVGAAEEYVGDAAAVLAARAPPAAGEPLGDDAVVLPPALLGAVGAEIDVFANEGDDRLAARAFLPHL